MSAFADDGDEAHSTRRTKRHYCDGESSGSRPFVLLFYFCLCVFICVLLLDIRYRQSIRCSTLSRYYSITMDQIKKTTIDKNDCAFKSSHVPRIEREREKSRKEDFFVCACANNALLDVILV